MGTMSVNVILAASGSSHKYEAKLSIFCGSTTTAVYEKDIGAPNRNRTYDFTNTGWALLPFEPPRMAIY